MSFTFLSADFWRRILPFTPRPVSRGEGNVKVAGLVSRLLAACPDRVLVTNEIGYGIVPLDPFEREYREETGRICCLLAAEAKEVWRVSCGLGQRIK